MKVKTLDLIAGTVSGLIAFILEVDTDYEFFKASYLSVSTVILGFRTDFISKEKSCGALPALKGIKWYSSRSKRNFGIEISCFLGSIRHSLIDYHIFE